MPSGFERPPTIASHSLHQMPTPPAPDSPDQARDEVALDAAERAAEAFNPGEEPAAVVVEMLCGTIATALASVDPQEVRHATELIDLSGDRVLEHLRLACALSRRIHGGDGGIRGSDG